MHFRKLVAICIALVCAFNAHAGAQDDAKKLKEQLTGETRLKSADNPVCKLFSQAEMTRYLGGVKIEPAETTAAGYGCSWHTRDYEALVTVAIIGARDFVAPTLAKGYKTLPHVGAKGYTVRNSDGWESGAVDGDKGIAIQVIATTATEAIAVSILQETIKRRQR